MSEQETVRHPVIIKDQPVLDLSHLTSAEEMAAIDRIEDVALVVVPESLAAAYAAIPSSDVASTIYVPGGANVRVHTGSLVTSGDGLGAADDLLVVVGMLLITSPVTTPLPRGIIVIGSALAPRGSEPVLGPAIAASSGSISYYKYADGQDIKVHSGQVKLSGTMLANRGGQPEDMLIVAGQVTVTGEVTTIGYLNVFISGQVAAPEASRDLLESVAQIQGQVCWYKGGDPRVFTSDATLGPDFFRLLDHPVSLVVFGSLSLAAGVTETMMLEKITGITLFGDITAPPELLGAVQVLATDVFGDIRATDGSGS
jgi:hypothetical protein